MQQRYAGLPPDLAQHTRDITQMLESRQLDDAESALATALARMPGHPELLRLLGVAQYLRKHAEKAINTLLKARAACPDDALIHDTLGSCYETVSDYARARAALSRACSLDPDNAQFYYNYANRLNMDGDSANAAEALARALKLAPRHIQARALQASMAVAEGRRDEGETLYRGIISDNPAEAGMTWWWLATLKPMPLNDDDIALMRQVVEDPATTAANRSSTGFALAIGLEHQGRFEQAFHALQTSHALVRQYDKPYDAGRLTRLVDEILNAFDVAPNGAVPSEGEEAIFVVSMPRSGSTLTEQILASHSQVEGGGELADMSQLLQDESARTEKAFPAWVADMTPELWRVFGQRYLARTRRWRRQRPRFTDKRPGNWLHVGAILASLPKARVVIARRDPLENCLGCYRYMVNHDYSHDFADLAAAWRDFDRAATHWAKLHPERVRVQVYEDLVLDPEKQIRELLAFCDLPFEQACLHFHTTERRVATPSATQVREPIRRDTARAHKYGALLDPLRAELGLPPFEA
ncbi:MAG: sulfotransferase [Rudaea sp.]